MAIEAIDSGVVLGEYPVIRWMDNERVIFLGASGEHCKREDRPDSYKRPLNRIAIFDTRSRELSWYGEKGIAGLCYAEGNISYARLKVTAGFCPTDEWMYFRGRLGQEAALPGVPLDTYSCLPEAEVREAPPWLEEARKSGRLFKPLKPEHGWVEMAIHPRGGIRANPTYPIKIHRPGSNPDEGTALAEVFREHLLEGYYLDPPKYIAVKNAYIVRLGYFQSRLPPRSEPLPEWWVYPDGKITKVEYKNPNSQYWGVAVFTRPGALLIHHSFSERARKEDGLYADEPNGPVRLDSGHITDHTAVSPDGCKLAYGNDPRGFWAEGPRQFHLRIIDVCTRNAK